jgi:hypothetical protein
MCFTSIFLVLVTSALVMFEPRAGAAGDVVISDAYASYFQRGRVKLERASLMAQVRIWGEGQKSVSLRLARLPLDGSRPQSLESADGTPLGTSDFPLLGRSGNETLFLSRYTATILRR